MLLNPHAFRDALRPRVEKVLISPARPSQRPYKEEHVQGTQLYTVHMLYQEVELTTLAPMPLFVPLSDARTRGRAYTKRLRGLRPTHGHEDGQMRYWASQSPPLYKIH